MRALIYIVLSFTVASCHQRGKIPNTKISLGKGLQATLLLLPNRCSDCCGLLEFSQMLEF